MSLRARKKARTREALATHALALFGQHGFDSVTINRIAEASGVSRRTFFRYFGSKEAAVFPDYAARIDAFQQLVRASSADDPFDRVQEAMLALAHHYMADREAHLLRWQVIASAGALVAYERELDMSWEAEIAVAFGAESADPLEAWRALTMAGSVMGTMRAVVRDWFQRGAQDDLVALGRAGLGLLRDGWTASRRVQ